MHGKQRGIEQPGDFQMQSQPRFDRNRPGFGPCLRIRTLVTCLTTAIALGGGQVAAWEQPSALAVQMGQSQAAIAQWGARLPHHTGSIRPVSSCADDGSPGTLRAVVASAVSGDTIDLTALTCSTITLQQGAIFTDLYDISFEGPGPNQLTIDGNGVDRVIVHFAGQYSSLSLSGLTLTHGYTAQAPDAFAAAGGCVYAGWSLVLQNSVVTSCKATGTRARGGAIEAVTATLVGAAVRDSVAEASQYAAYGGGLYSSVGATMTDSTVSGNKALGAPGVFYSYGFGGGAFSRSPPAILTNTTINENEADYGGGIFAQVAFYDTPPFEIENSTISGNIAHRGGGGASIAGSVLIANSTIAFNQAGDYGSGGIVFGYTYPAGAATFLDVESTIIANNAVTGTSFAADVGNHSGTDATVVGANSLIVASNLTVPGDTIRLDPLLGPLADNGGPTRTHALLPGSPAIDAGSNTLNFEFDQRGAGYFRVIGPTADIGAFESPPPDSPDLIFASGFEGAAPP
jgi:hypothetical protein